MKSLKIPVMMFALACFGAIVLPKPAKADEWNQKTLVKFTGPVEIPGVVLPRGTYVFKLADSQSDRNIVQVFNKDENQIYATILAIPDYRVKPTGKTVMTFEERPKGSPEAIRDWFYPGSQYGQEFVYPKPRAIELAKTNQQPVPSVPALVSQKPAQPAEVQAMKTAPITAVQPSGNEVQLAEVHSPEPSAAPAPAAPLPKKLPKTASSLPWFLLIGTLSLIGSFSLKLAATRVS